MAGTRCAHPEYQLDVDTMMVEYTLYKGIDAQLQLLVILSEQLAIRDPHDMNLVREQAKSCLRLTEIYDRELTMAQGDPTLTRVALIALHKNNHGDTFSSNTQRNGQILRFLVQINSWAAKKFEGLEYLLPQASREMRERQQQNMIVNQSCRRIWLKANGGSEDLDSDSDAFSWHTRNRRVSLADHLLPLFIWISTDLFEISKTPRLSFEWMKLATKFMVQAAIDILDEPELLASGSDVVHNLIQECFAWGRLDQTHLPVSVDAIIGKLNMKGFVDIDTEIIDHVTAMEARCQDMFREYPSIDKDFSGRGSLSGTQTPSWKFVKQEAIEDVLMTFISIQEAEGNLAYRPIELLKRKYPLTTLLTDINDFIAVHWKLLHSKAWHGRPILVQIEEGGIDGLSLEEFEDFKDRVGIHEMWSSGDVYDD